MSDVSLGGPRPPCDELFAEVSRGDLYHLFVDLAALVRGPDIPDIPDLQRRSRVLFELLHEHLEVINWDVYDSRYGGGMVLQRPGFDMPAVCRLCGDLYPPLERN